MQLLHIPCPLTSRWNLAMSRRPTLCQRHCCPGCIIRQAQDLAQKQPHHVWRGVEALSGSLTSRDFAGNNNPSTSRVLTGKAWIPSALVQHVLHRRIFGLRNFSFDASLTRHPKPSHKLIRPCSCNYRRLVTAISDFGCSSLSLESQVRLLQSRTTQRGNPLSPSWPQGALQHLLFEALRGEHPHPRTRVLYSKWLRLSTTTCWCLSYLTTSCNPPHSPGLVECSNHVQLLACQNMCQQHWALRLSASKLRIWISGCFSRRSRTCKC